MSIKPNAAKAGRRTTTNEKAPGAGGAKGQKKTASKPLNSTNAGRQAQSKARSLGQMAAPPLSGELHDLLSRGAYVADAPAEALTDHPTVVSWHTISGGVGRLSDHIHVLRAWLRSTNASRAIVSAGIAVTAGARVQVVRKYWLAELVAVADLRQLALFDEGGEQ